MLGLLAVVKVILMISLTKQYRQKKSGLNLYLSLSSFFINGNTAIAYILNTNWRTKTWTNSYSQVIQCPETRKVTRLTRHLIPFYQPLQDEPFQKWSLNLTKEGFPKKYKFHVWTWRFWRSTCFNFRQIKIGMFRIYPK